MSAREELFEGLTDGGWNLAPGEADSVNAMIDAYRAEVRREVLGDDLNPSSLVLDAQAYRWLADDIIATMDDPDRWGADETEQVILSRYVKWLADGKPPRDDEWDSAPPPADFFQRGHGYTHRDGSDFLCLTVAPHPGTGELRAFGWRIRNGWHEGATLDPDDWQQYDGCTPPADASADRLPFLGDVDARAQACAAKLRGLLGGAS